MSISAGLSLQTTDRIILTLQNYEIFGGSLEGLEKYTNLLFYRY